MKILVTGANGFIGKNLVLRLREESGVEVLTYLRDEDDAALTGLLVQADAVVHLAGENRPLEESAFSDVNFGLTKRLCQHISALGKNTPVLFTSSVQADQDNPYGRSKIAAEQALEDLAEKHCNPVAIYRLPGVFGKWCKPNYNSVVATLCYNKARGLPTQVNDANARVRLVYIDDVVDALILQLDSSFRGLVRPTICPEYSITLGELSAQIDAFQNCRTTLVTEDVGTGFIRALYACYVSYLPTDKFAYDIPIHSDSRGMFVEMLKTLSAGQFSFHSSSRHHARWSLSPQQNREIFSY